MDRSRILLVSRDLMFASPITGEARRYDFELVVEADANRASQRVGEENWAAVLLDLTHTGIDPANFAETSVPIVAVGPHVHKAKLQQAEEAGCAMVLTKGQFSSNMSGVFSQLLGENDV